MLSDMIRVLFDSLRLDDEPVNVLVGRELCDIKDFYFDDRICEYVLELKDSQKYSKPNEKRFYYYEKSSEIVDSLTGYTYYCNNKEIVDLLNKMNNRADKNAEKYWDLKMKE